VFLLCAIFFVQKKLSMLLKMYGFMVIHSHQIMLLKYFKLGVGFITSCSVKMKNTVIQTDS